MDVCIRIVLLLCFLCSHLSLSKKTCDSDDSDDSDDIHLIAHFVLLLQKKVTSTLSSRCVFACSSMRAASRRREAS